MNPVHRFFKMTVDLISGTARKRRKFTEENPGEHVLAADGCKAIMTTSDSNPEYGTKWVTSKRAVLILTDKRIICGKWNIPLDTVRSAELLDLFIFPLKGWVLKVSTQDGKNYQFGLHKNQEWLDQKALLLTPKAAKMNYSVFSLMIRVLAIGYLIYYLYTEFIK